MPPTKGNFRNYTEEALLKAVNDVLLHKTPIREAAKKFGVPRTTIKYKVEGKVPMERKMGPPSILSKAEEETICQWIVKMAAAGFPVTVEQLITSVKKVIKDMQRPNPFKDGTPGKTWVKSFLKRNKNISRRVSQNLTSSRAAVTSSNIRNWFSEVHQYLKTNQLDIILNDPSRVFNCDETAFFLNPKGNRVLAKKGEKTVYQQVNADEKECVTVLVTACASGLVAPTTVLFKYKRVPQDIVDNFPAAWGIGKTDSGWMTCEAFYEFIADVFHPWLVETQIMLPIILFIDGHSSHLSLQTSKFCDTHGIILVALYPNATHLLQPLDVTVFRTLKEGWRNKVHDWRINNLEAPTLKKKDFPKLLKEVIDERVTKDILANGFRKCGLCPWNPSAVQIPGEEEMHYNSNAEMHLARIKYLQEGLKFLNENLEKDKINSFQCSSETWEGDIKDSSLFLLWKKIQTELETYGNCVGQNISVEPANSFNQDNIELDDSISSAELIHQAEVLLNTIDMLTDTTLPDDGNSSIPMDDNDVNLGGLDEIIVVVEQPSSNPNSPTALPNTEAAQTPILPQDKASTSYDSNPAGLSQKVPSPFKKHFFYQNKDAKTKKRRMPKEKMPAVVSGKQFHEYFQKRIARKEEEERLKKERANERERKREERDKANESKSQKPRRKKVKKLVSCPSESSSSSDEDIDSDGSVEELSRNEQDSDLKFLPVKRQINEFVIFVYEGEYFPGKITNVKKKAATITSMKRCGRLWQWPEKPDILNYEWGDVVSHIGEPLKTSKTRNMYSVPELDFLWN